MFGKCSFKPQKPENWSLGGQSHGVILKAEASLGNNAIHTELVPGHAHDPGMASEGPGGQWRFKPQSFSLPVTSSMPIVEAFACFVFIPDGKKPDFSSWPGTPGPSYLRDQYPLIQSFMV